MASEAIVFELLVENDRLASGASGDLTLQQPPVRPPHILRTERGMLAPPTKINERIGMSLYLQQFRSYLALQPAERRRRPQRLTGSAYGVDRHMGGEIHTGPGDRLQGTPVPVRRQRACDRAPLCGVAVVDHQSAAATLHDHLYQFCPCHIPSQPDLSSITTRPPAVRPSQLLVLQARPGLLYTFVVDDHFP